MPAYQWNAADYAQASTVQQLWARELIAKLHLQGHERVLDIGCGDGKVTAEIAAGLERGAVVGIDNSAAMIMLAEASYPRATWANLSFQKADAADLPFAAEFDLVFSNATLHWVLDHAPVLRGIGRSLRPGGMVLLQMGGRGNALGVIAAVEQVCANPAWRSYFEGMRFPYGFYGPEEYRGWLAQAGLTTRRVELIPKDMRYANRAGLEGWFRTTWLPYTQRVPEALRPAFIDQVMAAYLEKNPPDAGGEVHVQMTRLEVETSR
jgi:trans-aconitate 2-methyltransferase